MTIDIVIKRSHLPNKKYDEETKNELKEIDLKNKITI